MNNQPEAYEDFSIRWIEFIERMFGRDYYAEIVYADGPWEAMFIFCGRTRFNPSVVTVSPMIRSKGYGYSVSVSRPSNEPYISPYVTLEAK